MSASKVSLEESKAVNRAMRIAKIINKEQEWPSYVKSPYEYVQYYHKIAPQYADVCSWELRGSVIDFDILISDSAYPKTKNLLYLFINPTYEFNGNPLSENVIENLRRNCLSLRYRFTHAVHLVFKYYSCRESLIQKLNFMQKLIGVTILIETDVSYYYSHDEMEFWWEMVKDNGGAYQFHSSWDNSLSNVNSCFDMAFCMPYEHYKKGVPSDIMPLSVMTNGTPEEMLEFVERHMIDKLWYKIPNEVIAKRNIKLSFIPTNEETFVRCLKCGILRDECVVEAYKILDKKMKFRFIKSYIRDHPIFEIEPIIGYSISLNIIARINGMSELLSTVGNGLNIKTVLSYIKPWKPEHIGLITTHLNKFPRKEKAEFVRVHSSFRNTRTDNVWWHYKQYWIYPEDITYYEYCALIVELQKDRSINYDSVFAIEVELSTFDHFMREQKCQKKMMMMLAARIGMVTDLACIIREYV